MQYNEVNQQIGKNGQIAPSKTVESDPLKLHLPIGQKLLSGLGSKS
jgi:hypothetical protein